MKIAVYGSLRQGMGNHRLMGNSTLIGKGLMVDRATMFSNGGFPILSFSIQQEKPILAEVYQVDDPRTQQDLDRLEGYPEWYTRTEREFILHDGSTVTAWIYHQDKDFRERLPVVESGDWVEYRMRA